MAVAFGAISVQGGSTVNKPTGLASGDLCLIFWENDGGGTAACTGFTAILRVVMGGGHSAGLLYKIADGSEGSTFTITGIGTGYNESWALSYTGVDTTTPINASESNASATTASITTTVNGCMEVAFTSYDFGSSNAAAPSGWTRRLNGSGAYNFWGGERAQASSGATGTQAFTSQGNTGGDEAVIHIAIAPAGGSGGGTAIKTIIGGGIIEFQA